jgi:uncharacterized repeat protein (TIGR01451 family)
MTDLDGESRPLGANCDMGPYEYAGIGFIKGTDYSEVNPGETFTYTIRVVNASAESLTGSVITDSLPSELGFIGPITLAPGGAGTVGSSPPELVTDLDVGVGEQVVVTFPVSVSFGLEGGTFLTNTARITGSAAALPLTASVVVSVTNTAPVAVDDAGNEYSTYFDTPFTTGNVLDNDFDTNGDVISVESYDTSVLSGTLTSNGDGTFEYDPNGMFDDLPGQGEAYDVFTYVVSDGALTDTATVTITITNPIIPVVDAGPNQTVDEGAVVEFEGSFDNPSLNMLLAAETYHWDFGDGATVTGTLTPTHTYADNGVYTVTLTVTNTYGNAGSDSLLVTVENIDPVLGDLPDQDVDAGEVITVTGTITDPGVLDTQTVVIDWADGVTTTISLDAIEREFEVTHVYSVAGHYTVNVEVTDKDGGTDDENFLTRVFMKFYFPLISNNP